MQKCVQKKIKLKLKQTPKNNLNKQNKTKQNKTTTKKHTHLTYETCKKMLKNTQQRILIIVLGLGSKNTQGIIISMLG